jgi:hypothetical protein
MYSIEFIVALPNRGIKNELVNKNIVKQDLDEMKSIKY